MLTEATPLGTQPRVLVTEPLTCGHREGGFLRIYFFVFTRSNKLPMGALHIDPPCESLHTWLRVYTALVGLSQFAVHLLRLVEVDNNATALWSTKFFVVILLIYLTLPRFHFSSVAQQRSTPRHPPRQGRDEVFLDIFQPCLNSAHPLARSTSFGKFESLCYVTDRADNSS